MMDSLAFIHGLIFGLPLVVLVTLCVSYTARLGHLRPWAKQPREAVQRWVWRGLLFFAWATMLSGMSMVYAYGSEPFLHSHTGWKTLGLPWMASWGTTVPLAVTACVYVVSRARRNAHPLPGLQRALWILMTTALGNTLLTALLGSLTAQGIFYR